jgi:hypothetical protein
LEVNVFNSSNIKSKSWRDDPDLGSPNSKCHPKEPGIGAGGIPGSAFPNCEALGNLLILQNPRVTDHHNDDPNGGCISFDLYYLSGGYFGGADVSINDFGVLDIEEGAIINVSRNPVSEHA